jgi:multiple sugar transport system ATP-binding protein
LYALYPHMNARQNISFPLQAEGMDKADIEKRVEEVVKLLRIETLLNTRPSKLSGGDKQRIALARALVRRPAAFLMDEPLGALDAEFRETMRAEIKRLHLNIHATTVYVTHDQIEAMAMSDRIVVMSAAEVQQVGTPAEVYYDPANLFVARFIGSPGMNLIEGHYGEGVIRLPGENGYPVPNGLRASIENAIGDGPAVVGFRPEAAEINAQGALTGNVYATDLHGAYTMLHVNLNENEIVHIRGDRTVSFPIGTQVRFNLNPEMVRFFHPETEKAIRQEGRP